MSPRQQPVNFQGIQVPSAIIDLPGFYAGTRRQRIPLVTNRTWSGLGSTDSIAIRRTGILANLHVTVTGDLVTAAAQPAGVTFRWPYDLLRNIKFSANGQANLISSSGRNLKFRELANENALDDRGVSRNFGGSTITSGSLSLDSDVWGAAPGVQTAASQTQSFELSFKVPVAYDDKSLIGAVFAQTTASDLQLDLSWANTSDLFVTTGGNFVPSLNNVKFSVSAEVYTIPLSPDGSPIVPDLRMFHQLTQVSPVEQPGVGDNEFTLSGQTPGRQLMRVWFTTWNPVSLFSTNVPKPLAINSTNYGEIGWKFGGNDTPEVYQGLELARINERIYNSNVGKYHGIACLDFASKFAMRDSIDLGAASELRLTMQLLSGASLTSPTKVEYVQELMLASTVGV